MQELRKPTDIDRVAQVRDLAPVIRAAGDQIEQERQLPADLMASLHDAGLFRLCLPRSLGGAEVSALTEFEVMEQVAMADASTAWCLGQAHGCSLAAGYLEPGEAAEIFGPADAVVAWGPFNKTGHAVEVEGGYRLSGTWHYASGIHNATWLGAHIPVTQADGTPGIEAGGAVPNRTFLFPAAQAAITEIWDVIGLRGTGSEDYSVEDLFVPANHSFIQNTASERHEAGPLYRIAIFTFYGFPFAGTAIGVARAALSDFIELAASKIAYRTTNPLRENAVIQQEVALAEARLSASRAFMVEAIEEVWEAAGRGDELPLERRTRFRLAVTYAINQAREVVETVYRAAGGTAVFNANPFERRLRDMSAISQQAQAAERNYQAVGQALMGLVPEGGRL